MDKGIVQEIRGSFGFIKAQSGKVFFHREQLQGIRIEELREGDTVVYEWEKGPKGPRATVVRLEGAAPRSQPVQSAPPPQKERRADAAPLQGASRSSGDAYRFLNPYNFIRYLGPPKSKPDNKQPETWQLWRCPPPPHDRYTGLSGRITCEVEAVTPLFISDSHAIDKPDKHPTYRFFEYEGEPALPPTSLRGMVRSVFEAATNSCFSVFDERRLSYRLAATRASSLIPARVEKRNGAWVLQLLPGFTPLDPGRRPNNLYAATINLYDPLKPSRPRGGGRPANPPKVRMHGISALKHGERYYALVDKKGIFTIVDDIADNPSNLPRPTRSQSVVEGWVCFNNQNVDNKRKERFFFRDSNNSVGPTFIPLPGQVLQHYEDLIADYQIRHKEEVEKRDENKQPRDDVIRDPYDRQKNEPALSRYMYDKKDLEVREGTLVYVSLSGTALSPVAQFMVPAAVPRVAYKHTLADALRESHLHACEDVRKLCPACRVFGWVRHVEPGENLREDVTVAYAGRLRFSYGKVLNDAGALPTTTLAILSSPKPTTTRFYLRPAQGKPRDNLEDEQAGYDGPNILRGRKFYRHQGEADPQEYKRATGPGVDGKDDQNRTVRGARKPGTTFRFAIDFHNLAPAELGALLWALELREDGKQGCHRLGFAKPLGFGSVRLTVTGLETMDPAARYVSVDDDGWQDALARKDAWITQFRETMTTLYGTDFAALDNIRDLMALAGDPADLPVHYPRTTRRPAPEGKNFEWFMGNNRAGRDHGPRLALKLADEDVEGLPLLDKYGKTTG
jgi:CRISPR-associated protein (TIGR03986 family)